MLVHHKPIKILVVAQSGSGKTTYVIRYVKNSHHTHKIIFDHKLEFLARESIEPYYSRDELIEAVIRKEPIISYNHLEEFPGNAQGAFEWFCEWVYEVAKVTQKPMLFVCDEVNRFTGSTTNDWEFMQSIEDGRLWGLDFIGTSHGANSIHNRLRAQLTEIVAMKTQEPLPLKWLEGHGFDTNEVSNLNVGEFILKDCMRGKFVVGKLFNVAIGRDIDDNDGSQDEQQEQEQKDNDYEGPSHGSGNLSGGGRSGSDAIGSVSESSHDREP